MKLTKKLVSLLLAVMLVAALFSIPALAAADDVKLVAEQSGDNVVVNIVANTDLDFGGVFGVISYDKDAFTFTGVTSELFGSISYNPNNGYAGGTDGDYNVAAAGDVILTMTFAKKDGFQKDVDYTFNFEIDEAYDHALDDFDWVEFSTTYKEAGEAPVVYHTVTFMNGEEEFLKVEDVVDGQPVAKPATTPTAPEGKRFAYWAKDGAKYDFSTPVTEDITLTAVFEDIPSHEIEITKKVNADIEYPEITFTFEVGDGEYEGPVSDVTAPAIDDATVTMSGTDTEATATINLDDITWPAGGVYTYPLTEKDDGEEGWEYDDTEYELVVTVEPNENTGALEISNVFVKKGTEKGEVEFENTYAPVTDLTIKKVVAADPKPTDGYGTEEFTFTVVFDEGFEGTIDGVAHTFEANVPYEFTLKNGDEIVIGNIPAGIHYTVVEAETPYYTATAEVVNGTEQPTVPDGEFGEGITVGSIEIAAAAPGTNKVTVTNTYSITPPTGVTIRGEMIGIMVLVLVALAGSFVLSRKLRRRA